MMYRNKLATNPIQHANHGLAQAASTNGQNGEAAAPSLTEQMTGFINGVKEKASQLIELTEQIANGRFVGANLSKSLREQAEGLSTALDMLWGHVTNMFLDSASGSQQSDGPSISSGPEYGLNQILDVEKQRSEANAHSEPAVFSLSRIREEAMKALRCQGNIEPEKALFLLQNDVI